MRNNNGTLIGGALTLLLIFSLIGWMLWVFGCYPGGRWDIDVKKDLNNGKMDVYAYHYNWGTIDERGRWYDQTKAESDSIVNMIKQRP